MILMVAAEKGGVGKTSIAVNIAAIAANRGVDVILLDGDSTGSSCAWARIRSSEEVAPALAVMPLDWRNAASAPQVLATLAKKHELIVLDVGARSYDVMLRSALLADLMLVPVAPGQFEAESTGALFEQLRRLDIQHKGGRIPAHVVLTMLPTNAKSTEEGQLRAWLTEEEIPVLRSSLRHRKAWRDVSREGRALHELKGRAALLATDEMSAVYAEAERLVE